VIVGDDDANRAHCAYTTSTDNPTTRVRDGLQLRHLFHIRFGSKAGLRLNLNEDS
jgi:hypothetical protein